MGGICDGPQTGSRRPSGGCQFVVWGSLRQGCRASHQLPRFVFAHPRIPRTPGRAGPPLVQQTAHYFLWYAARERQEGVRGYARLSPDGDEGCWPRGLTKGDAQAEHSGHSQSISPHCVTFSPSPSRFKAIHLTTFHSGRVQESSTFGEFARPKRKQHQGSEITRPALGDPLNCLHVGK